MHTAQTWPTTSQGELPLTGQPGAGVETCGLDSDSAALCPGSTIWGSLGLSCLIRKMGITIALINGAIGED